MWQRVLKDPVDARELTTVHSHAEIAEMLREVGIALLEIQQPTQLVAGRLIGIAAQYTEEKVRVIALPAALMIQVGSVAYEVDAAAAGTTQLDFAGAVDDIAERAAVGAIAPGTAIEAIAAARRAEPRFGTVLTTIGYAITTAGFGMVINPTWVAIPAYLFLGLVVGAMVTACRPFPTLTPALPTLAAMVVTVMATWFVADAVNDELLRVISPALVALLPGLSLTVGAMELASSEIVAGASRVVYGLARLLLLVFGVSLGLQLVGHSVSARTAPVMGSWAQWVAIAVITVGLYLYLSAPRGSLPWLMAAIAVALCGQHVGQLVASPSHSGAIGALLVVPFAALAGRIKTSPPALVMLTAAFWALVPGSLTFVSLSEAATGVSANAAALGSTIAAVLSIALGSLLGFSIVGSFTTWQQRTR